MGRPQEVTSGCSLFRGALQREYKNQSTPLPSAHQTASDPQNPRAFPGCSGQIGQSPLPLPATRQPPLRPGKMVTIYLVANYGLLWPFLSGSKFLGLC